MFGFFKRQEAPPQIPGNPGEGTEISVAFAGEMGNWNEEANVVKMTADILKQHGHRVQRKKSWLVHSDTGYILQPLLADFQMGDNGLQTTTTIQINHPTLVPDGIFEYQHSFGDSLTESLQQGIDQWAQTDFVALVEATLPEPEHCSAMEMELPAENGSSGLRRRAILGPVMHFAEERAPVADDEEHPFCPCCLLTQSFEAFKDLMTADRFYALRLYAARYPDGNTEADCRVNGEDFDQGEAALIQYARRWAPAGVEFRKQYVILQTLGSQSDSG